MSVIKATGLVVAAGLSSRMGAFKPLLDLAGKPLICRTVESLLQGGAEQVVVVTGRNQQAITQALENYPEVQTVYNRLYEQTTMYDSIKLGLQQLPVCDVVLFLPADIPSIRPETIGLLLHRWEQTRPDVLLPVYQNACWHPPLIAGNQLAQLLQYHGDGGLKTALETLCENIETEIVPDVGCTLDADYQKDYAYICRYWPRRYRPDWTHCQSFYQLAATPEPVQQHCRAVAEKALALGELLQQRGVLLQLDLLESAALLHDVCRTKKGHAAAGAAFLRYYGLEQVAQLVEVHMDWPQNQPVTLNEAAVLYLADKLVSGDGQVPLADRFAEKRKKYAAQQEIEMKIVQREQTALEIIQLLKQQGIPVE